MCFALQVQALAEFGDLPKNVDLIVLQQQPHSSAFNFIEVLIASQRNTNPATVAALCSYACVDSALFLCLILFAGRGLQSIMRKFSCCGMVFVCALLRD